MACSSGELHAIFFLWAHVFYVLILPFYILVIGKRSLCKYPSRAHIL